MRVAEAGSVTRAQSRAARAVSGGNQLIRCKQRKMQLHFTKEVLPDSVGTDYQNLNKLNEQCVGGDSDHDLLRLVLSIDRSPEEKPDSRADQRRPRDVRAERRQGGSLFTPVGRALRSAVQTRRQTDSDGQPAGGHGVEVW
ncbi:hypothetical protein E3U43_014274, partial [Larimichthys crocea]